MVTAWLWPSGFRPLADARLLDLNLTYQNFTLVQPIGINRNQTMSWGGLAIAALIHIAHYALQLKEVVPLSGKRNDDKDEGIFRPATVYHAW